MYPVIDTNHIVLGKLDKLQIAGIRTIIRYINPLNLSGEKTVKIAEAKAIADAGMRLGLVCEGWGDFEHSAISADAGARDGRICHDYAIKIGAPPEAVIWSAVDTDCTTDQIVKYVLPYFRAFKSAVYPQFRVGIYACGAACAAVLGAASADRAWLPNATGWNGSHDFKVSGRWSLLQHLPFEIAGLDTDPNEINPLRPDIGDFVPFVTGLPKPIDPATYPGNIATPHDIAWLQQQLNAIVAPVPLLDVDNRIGPLTIAAMIKLLETLQPKGQVS